MDDVDVNKDYIEALLKRNYTMQKIGDLLRKKIHILGDFRCVWFSVFSKIMTFTQGNLLIRNSRILQEKQLKFYGVVKTLFGKLRDIFVNLPDQNQVVEHWLQSCIFIAYFSWNNIVTAFVYSAL